MNELSPLTAPARLQRVRVVAVQRVGVVHADGAVVVGQVVGGHGLVDARPALRDEDLHTGDVGEVVGGGEEVRAAAADPILEKDILTRLDKSGIICSYLVSSFLSSVDD